MHLVPQVYQDLQAHGASVVVKVLRARRENLQSGLSQREKAKRASLAVMADKDRRDHLDPLAEEEKMASQDNLARRVTEVMKVRKEKKVPWV